MDELIIRDLEASYGNNQVGIARTREARVSLEKSADALAQENGDYWLLDFVRSKDSYLLRTATSYLARAIHENLRGEPDSARLSARQAQQI
ncbi:MAG TPA: hypothetical protein VIK39_04695, partial [Candidatus Angelobacter sp.]